MEGRKIESVVRITSEENITHQQEQYRELCKQVSEVRNHYFKEGDFFFHEVLGIDKASSDQSNGEFYSHTDQSLSIPAIDSLWLPTVDQIKELLCSHGLEHLIENFNTFIEKERITASSLEKQWLIYYKSIIK